jgi:phage terminase small subunit
MTGKVMLANTSRNTLKPVDGEGLTSKQKLFVDIFTKNEGRLTPTECARQAGYKTDRANVTSSELMNVKKYPRVSLAINKRRQELEKTHQVNLNKHVQELARIRDAAYTNESYSAAVNAEKMRGQAAGLYVERKEIRHGSIDDMSREEVLSKLKELGLDGKFKKEGNKTVISVKEKSNGEGIKDITPVQAEGSEGQDGL